MAAMLEISLIPSGKADASLGEVVANALKIARDHNIRFQLNPMGTTMEGDLDTLLQIARKMHEMCFAMGYPRVQSVIKIDDRRDKDLTMDYKVASVMKKLG
ncbi:MAG: MTH1187 family thiamine-binding protein [Armatimonadetes bacterium]|nr:MTH1187 family thiamine-binding protein [Armatimonadota bacterium]NIM23164.1 MTH1187 family thiamine-binding protein [Armatimonadota bacterium]NIM67032.1 MTH1187 family thiamine-binding protein [Armatimonadota bacterium]NIM75566.1 MTH1187 family thiamine-binding protein [Armatimonadota bacterium]NIN05221.1 MTH1187 family thiamine-binding protein [Armatimonadota bacterium]